MRSAKSYAEWLPHADQYDRTQGYHRWKAKRESTLYDYKYIAKLESLLKRYKDQEDHKALIRLLRANITRNVGGILNPRLYEYSVAGTKELIAKFQKRTLEAF